MTAVWRKTLFLIHLFIVSCFGEEKRLLLHDDEAIAHSIQNLTAIIHQLEAKTHALETAMAGKDTKINALESTLSQLQVANSAKDSGSTYVRWGHKTCPGNGTELIYSGFVAGSLYSDTGGGSNYICLAPDPLWGHYEDAVQAGGKLYGAEYELDSRNLNDFFGKNLRNADVPCAVCRSQRPTTVMIPGRNACYRGWTVEYAGYLSSGYTGHPVASEYVCLDSDLDYIVGSHADNNGKLFYFVEGICGSLECPPYVNGREITCAVCSK